MRTEHEIRTMAEEYKKMKAFHQAKLLYWTLGETMKVSDEELGDIPRGNIPR